MMNDLSLPQVVVAAEAEVEAREKWVLEAAAMAARVSDYLLTKHPFRSTWEEG